MSHRYQTSAIKWVGTPPPNGQGVFAIVDGKRVGGVIASALAGQSQKKPFTAVLGEWLEFAGYFKTLEDAKKFVAGKLS